MNKYSWPAGWNINKSLPCCECYNLDPRVAEYEKLIGNWIFNKFECSGVVVVVVWGVEYKTEK